MSNIVWLNRPNKPLLVEPERESTYDVRLHAAWICLGVVMLVIAIWRAI